MREIMWNRKTVSVALLAVALPGIVVTFWLLGRGITIAENTTLDPVVWTFQRPNQTIHRRYDVNCELNATYVSDGILATPSVLIGSYIEHSAFMGDFVTLGVEVNAATNPNGYIESVNVVVQKDQMSTVDWITTEFDFENLSLMDSAYAHTWETQAYIKLAGVNHTNNAYASGAAIWSFQSPNTQSHQMEIAYEIIYYNGTAYNKVVQPFQLNIIGAEGE